MTLENIKIGVLYKYKTLCTLLDEPYKNHCSKDAQLANWKRFFDWERQGQKYLITKIYDTPLSATPLGSRKKPSKYALLLYPLIINKIYKNFIETKHTVFRESKLSFYRSVGFSSRIIDDKPDFDYSFDSAIFQEVKSNFFEVTSRIFKRGIENLNKIEKIKCQEVHYIFHLKNIKQEGNTILAPIEQDNPVLATAQEEELIVKYLAEIKSELQIQKQLYLLLYDDNERFIDLFYRLNKKLANNKIQCKYTLWQFSLFDGSKNIETLYNECFKDKTIEQCEKEMNNAVLNLMKKKTIREARLAKNNYNLNEARKQEIFWELTQTGVCDTDDGLLSIELFVEEYTKRRNKVIDDFIKIQ